jgi:hypothetical protein
MKSLDAFKDSSAVVSDDNVSLRSLDLYAKELAKIYIFVFFADAPFYPFLVDQEMF